MMQSRKHSMYESVSNIAIGYIVAIASQLAVFPLFGIYVGIGDNLAIGAYFTAISLIRSYTVRRWWNWRLSR